MANVKGEPGKDHSADEPGSVAIRAARDTPSAFDRDAVQAINQRIFDTSLDLILVVDSHGTFVRVSPSSVSILGYGPDEMVGHSAAEFLYYEDLDNTRNEMRLARRRQMTRNFECRYVHKQGRVVTLWWTGVWSNPEHQYFFIGRDITDRKEAERLVLESEARLALAVEIAEIGLASSDAGDAVALVNTQFNRIYGRPEPDTSARFGDWIRQVHAEDRDRVAGKLRTAMSAGELYRDEFRITRLDTGEERWVRVAVQARPDPLGGPGRVLAVNLDITDLKRAAEVLRESEARLALATEIAEIGLASAETGKDPARTNAQFNSIYGCPPDKVDIGVGEWLRLIHPDDRDRVAARVLALIRQGGLYRDEFRIARADTGEERWVRAVTQTMLDAAGRPGRFLGVHIDITDLKQNAGLLQAAMDVAQLGSWLSELTSAEKPDARLEWSPETCRICGFSEGTFDNRLATFWNLVHPEDREAVHAASRSAIERGEPYDVEHRIIRPDGTVRWVHQRAGVIKDAAGTPITLAGVIQDVTGTRLVQEQLRQAQKMEAIGNLTGGMAHDFNNLLGVIIGNLDLLVPLAADKNEAAELVQEATEAAVSGAELTRRLLAFARRQPLRPQRIDPNELICNIVRLLRRTLGENIEIRLDLTSNLWPVVADPAQLEAALTNLATNARDAMPRGGQLAIATSNRHFDTDYAATHVEVRPGDYAAIEVTDSGIGMTPEVVERIFEPFYTTKAPGKGTGLGLSMVFGFIKQSGGQIGVYSEPGVGTTFRLYLPRAATETTAIEEGRPVDAPRGAGESVLAVEDNPAVRRVVLRQLLELGYRPIEAAGPAAALATLQQEKVDLLFSDVVMPGSIDGIMLAHQAIARWPHIKVVLTSGFPGTKLDDQLGSGGAAVRLLSKPYRAEDLARVLREALDG